MKPRHALNFTCTKVLIVGLKIISRPGKQGSALWFQECEVQLSGHLLGNFRLNRKNIFEILVITLGPDLCVVRDTDKLRRYAHSSTPFRCLLPAYSAFKHIIHSELFSNCPNHFFCILILECTGSGNNIQSMYGRQTAGNFLGNPVCEVFIFRRSQISKGKNNQHRSLW